jgi:hypothetical protein
MHSITQNSTAALAAGNALICTTSLLFDSNLQPLEGYLYTTEQTYTVKIEKVIQGSGSDHVQECDRKDNIGLSKLSDGEDQEEEDHE